MGVGVREMVGVIKDGAAKRAGVDVRSAKDFLRLVVVAEPNIGRREEQLEGITLHFRPKPSQAKPSPTSESIARHCTVAQTYRQADALLMHYCSTL